MTHAATRSCLLTAFLVLCCDSPQLLLACLSILACSCLLPVSAKKKSGPQHVDVVGSQIRVNGKPVRHRHTHDGRASGSGCDPAESTALPRLLPMPHFAVIAVFAAVLHSRRDLLPLSHRLASRMDVAAWRFLHSAVQRHLGSRLSPAQVHGRQHDSHRQLEQRAGSRVFSRSRA